MGDPGNQNHGCYGILKVGDSFPMIPNPKPPSGGGTGVTPSARLPPLLLGNLSKMVINYAESSKIVFVCIHLALHSEMLKMFFPDSFCLSPLASNASLCISNIVTVKSSQCYLQHKFENKSSTSGFKKSWKKHLTKTTLRRISSKTPFHFVCTT